MKDDKHKVCVLPQGLKAAHIKATHVPPATVKYRLLGDDDNHWYVRSGLNTLIKICEEILTKFISSILAPIQITGLIMVHIIRSLKGESDVEAVVRVCAGC